MRAVTGSINGDGGAGGFPAADDGGGAGGLLIKGGRSFRIGAFGGVRTVRGMGSIRLPRCGAGGGNRSLRIGAIRGGRAVSRRTVGRGGVPGSGEIARGGGVNRHLSSVASRGSSVKAQIFPV